MLSKDQFRLLVVSVGTARGKNQEELAIEMGYGKNYISEVLSPTGKLTGKFVEAFRRHYREYLEIPNNPSQKGLGTLWKEKKISGQRQPGYDTKEDILRMLDKSLDANNKHADANDKNASNLTLLVKMLAKQFNLNESDLISSPSQGEKTIEPNPVQQTGVFVGKKEIRYQKKQPKQRGILKSSDK